MVAQIDAFQAMLGTTLTMDGVLQSDKVVVQVPAGCQYGQHIELAGLGMPHLGGTGRGSLVVAVQVNVPTNLTDEQRLILEKVASLQPQEKNATQERTADKGKDNTAQKQQAQAKRKQRRGPFKGKRQ